MDHRRRLADRHPATVDRACQKPERIDGLSEIVEIGLHEVTKLLGRGHRVDVHDLVAMREQLPDRCLPGLATSACDDCAFHAAYSPVMNSVRKHASPARASGRDVTILASELRETMR